MDAARARKLADRIQQIVAEMLERRIKDPRLGFVTVTDARLTNDLRDATIYYTVYGTDGERADTAAALESAKGVIRSEVGRQTGLRHTPSLAFVLDAIPDNARHVDELLAKARAKDEQVARTAEGARPAGDPNPYREPAESESAESESADGEPAGDPNPYREPAGSEVADGEPMGGDPGGGQLSQSDGDTNGDAGYSAT